MKPHQPTKLALLISLIGAGASPHALARTEVRLAIGQPALDATFDHANRAAPASDSAAALDPRQTWPLEDGALEYLRPSTAMARLESSIDDWAPGEIRDAEEQFRSRDAATGEFASAAAPALVPNAPDAPSAASALLAQAPAVRGPRSGPKAKVGAAKGKRHAATARADTPQGVAEAAAGSWSGEIRISITPQSLSAHTERLMESLAAVMMADPPRSADVADAGDAADAPAIAAAPQTLRRDPDLAAARIELQDIEVGPQSGKVLHGLEAILTGERDAVGAPAERRPQVVATQERKVLAALGDIASIEATQPDTGAVKRVRKLASRDKAATAQAKRSDAVAKRAAPTAGTPPAASAVDINVELDVRVDVQLPLEMAAAAIAVPAAAPVTELAPAPMAALEPAPAIAPATAVADTAPEAVAAPKSVAPTVAESQPATLAVAEPAVVAVALPVPVQAATAALPAAAVTTAPWPEPVDILIPVDKHARAIALAAAKSFPAPVDILIDVGASAPTAAPAKPFPAAVDVLVDVGPEAAWAELAPSPETRVMAALGEMSVARVEDGPAKRARKLAAIGVVDLILPLEAAQAAVPAPHDPVEEAARPGIEPAPLAAAIGAAAAVDAVAAAQAAPERIASVAPAPDAATSAPAAATPPLASAEVEGLATEHETALFARLGSPAAGAAPREDVDIKRARKFAAAEARQAAAEAAEAPRAGLVDILLPLEAPTFAAGAAEVARNAPEPAPLAIGSETLAAEAAPRINPFGDRVVAISEGTLDGVRGGFVGDSGLNVSFGIERAVYVNGLLVTTTSFNMSDLGRITAGRGTTALDSGTIALVQSGAGNVVAAGAGAVTAGSLGTIIQNSLDGQKIQNVTTINASVNSLGVLRNINLQSSLRSAVIDSLRR